MLAAFLQNHIDHQSNFNYKNKTFVDDIYILVYELSEKSVCNTNTNKKSNFDNSDYLTDNAYQLIIKKRIENFNNKIVQLEKMLQSFTKYVFENTEIMSVDS